MSGAPFNALKEAVKPVGENILSLEQQQRPFEDYISIFYDDKVQMETFQSVQDYQGYLNRASIGGSTNFVAVFETILRLVSHKQGAKEEQTFMQKVSQPSLTSCHQVA